MLHNWWTTRGRPPFPLVCIPSGRSLDSLAHILCPMFFAGSHASSGVMNRVSFCVLLPQILGFLRCRITFFITTSYEGMNRRDPLSSLCEFFVFFFLCVVDPVSLLFAFFSRAHFLHGAPPLPSPQPPPWCTKGTGAAPRAGRGGQAAGPGVRRPRLEDHRPDPTGPPVRPLQRHVGPPGRAQAAAGSSGDPPEGWSMIAASSIATAKNDGA